MDYNIFYNYKDNYKKMVGDVLKGKVNFNFEEYFEEYKDYVGKSVLQGYKDAVNISFENGILNIECYDKEDDIINFGVILNEMIYYDKVTDVYEIKDILNELADSFEEFAYCILDRGNEINEIKKEFWLN